MKKLFLTQFPLTSTEDDLRALCVDFGAVTKTEIIRDPENGRSKGYAFVTMETKEGAAAAIQGLSGCGMGNGRRLVVEVAKEREYKGKRAG